MATFTNFPIPAASYEYQSSYYRALVAGAEYQPGDILRDTAQIDVSTGQLTGVHSWFNLDSLSPIGQPAATTDVEALDGSRIVVGTELLPIATGTNQLATIPATANYAEAHVWDGAIVTTVDGAAPTTAGNGYRQDNGQFFELESRQEITGFRAIRLNAAVAAQVYVTYYRVYGDAAQN